MAQGAELSVLFDDGCVVVNDVEYWIPPGADVSKVGTLVAFLEQQDGLRGKGKIMPYSAKKRKIVTNNPEGAKVEERKEEPPTPPPQETPEDADSAERLARLERIRKDRAALEERRKRIADQKGQVLRATEQMDAMTSRTEGTASPVAAAPPPAAPSATPAAGPGDDGLMSKLWKAAGSWFGGGDAPVEPTPPAPATAATLAPAPASAPAPAAPPSAAAALALTIPTIPPLSSPSPPVSPRDEAQSSPRVVVVQGKRAIPNTAAPTAPPSSAASPPQSPRGPRVPAEPATSPAVLKAFPRAASPAPTLISSSPAPDSTLLRAKQPQSAPMASSPAPDSTLLRSKQPVAPAPAPPAPVVEEPRASVSTWDPPPAPPLKPRRLLVEVPEFCLGRQALLTDLIQHAKERTGTGCVIVFVPGSVIPAGSGKTCLARKLAHALQDVYPGSHVELPLGGSSRENVDTATAKTALLARLGQSIADMERSYQGLFVGEGPMVNGLLLLDDARNADQVLPLLPVSYNCCLLITSRVTGLTLRSEAMRLVEVGALTDAEIMKDLPAQEPAPALRSISRMYNGIAANLLAKGRTREAEDMMKRVLAMRQKLLGDQHADVASSMVALASVYYRQGRYNEAETLYRSALTIQRAALGDAHKDTGQTLNNLASALNEQGKYKDAEELYRSALNAQKRAYGDQHPDTASVLQNLASVLTKQRKLDEAEASLRQALTIRRALYGDDHKDTASALGSLANLLDDQGKFKEAEQMQRQAAAAKAKVFGEETAQHASALDNLAATLCNVGNYAEAEKVLTQAHNIRRKLFGDNHAETIAGAKSLAAVRKRNDQTPTMRASPSPRSSPIPIAASPSPSSSGMAVSEPRPISPRPSPSPQPDSALARSVDPGSPRPVQPMAPLSPTPSPVPAPASPRPVEPVQTPYKCGWLTKRGNGVKTWKRRWFVLRNDVLNYMEHETAGEPKGSIPMQTVLAVEPGDKKPFCLALVTAPRTYYIVCKDHAELGEWLAVLKSVVARLAKTGARSNSPQRSPARPRP